MTDSTTCPVCGAAGHTFLDRSRVPVHQNLLLDTASRARGMQRGALQMCVCTQCEFVWNHAFDERLLDYGQNYDNTQVHSHEFDKYVNSLVTHLVEEEGIRNVKVVEVGCGKGGFLRKLVEYPGANIRGVGFDPTYVGPESDLDGRLQFFRTFYDERAASLAADVVICRHVIEHVAKPLDLLRSVHEALANSPQARVYFETPCVEWILQNRVVWDFFFEHCSLFSPASIRSTFERAGFLAREVRHVFGGQYLWLAGTRSLTPVPVSSPTEHRVAALAEQFTAHEASMLSHWKGLLGTVASKGEVALWGAGAKGVTFANLLDPEAQSIACVVDVNPSKQGRWLAGTGHPVVAPADLSSRAVQSILILNPNYRGEIEREVAQRGIKADVIDLMSQGALA